MFKTNDDQATCPNCRLPLQETPTKEDISIDICQQCWGIWLDGSKLEYACAESNLPPAIERNEITKTCPRCQSPMSELHYGSEDGLLAIDRCNQCQGLWFDNKKELIRLRSLTGKQQKKREDQKSSSLVIKEYSGPIGWLKNRMFTVKSKTDYLDLGGRALVLLFLIIYGFSFILRSLESPGSSFMNNVNLPFHEAGHIIFIFFGRFLRVLGGSLMQILMPFICVCAFLKYRNPFAASAALWWVAQSIMDVAVYINDARVQKLILLGGVTGRDVPGYHDWNVILRMLHLLPYDKLIAKLSHGLGVGLMLASFIWGGYILYLQSKEVQKVSA